MKFGEAFEHVKKGGLAARKGWNGKGMFIFMRPADTLTAGFIVNKVKSLPEGLKKWVAEHHEENDELKFTEYLCMKAADGTIVNGWVASQTDILAEDWEVI